jgi:uncharacterized SAM-binding protein YcdF (DUF218 family)
MERDAAIVLGAAVWPDGRPSTALVRRAERGAALLREGRARYLVACGGVVTHPPTEASWIRRIALDAGVPDTRILVDDLSRDTFENALASAALLRRHGLRTAFVVSDRYHLPRALFLLRRLGIEVEGCSAGDAAPPLRERIREIVAWPWSMLRVAWRLRGGRPPATPGAMPD